MQARAFHVLRRRDFRLLWSAGLISSLGSQIQLVAITWQVYKLTGSSLQLGLLGLFRFAPIFLFGLVGGVIADRRDRRRTFIATQIVLLIASAILAALTISDRMSMAAIYAVTFFTAIVDCVDGPAQQAFIPALVPRRELAGAMTMSNLAGDVAAVCGPAVGGLIIAHIGLGSAYLVDAVSFLAVIAALAVIKTRSGGLQLDAGGWEMAIEGLRFLRRSPMLLGVMSVDFVANFFGAGTVLLPIFASQILDVGPSGLGLLYAAPAAGAIAGGVVLSLARVPERPGAGIMLAVGIYGLSVAIFGLSGLFWLSLLALAISGGADAVSMALRHTLRNLLTPDELRGRIAAAHATFASGGPQLGEFESGVVASAIGAGGAIAIGGFGTLLMAIIVSAVVPSIVRYRSGATPVASHAETSAPHTSAYSEGRPHD